MAWTDERLEERFDSIDQRFDEVNRRFDDVDRRFDALVSESNRRFDRVEGAVAGLRTEMEALRTTLSRGSIGIMVGLVGAIAAILANGA